MRLVRYARDGASSVGIQDGDAIREVADGDGDRSVPPLIDALSGDGPQPTGTEHAAGDVDLLAPVARPGKIVCLGLNYHDHAEEAGLDVPEEPLLFSKATSAVVGPGDDVVYPHDVDQLDYEAELAVVVGRECRRVDRADALEYVAGFTAFNDVSARDVQYAFSQYFRGKSSDTFAPMGPAVVTPAELDTSSLSIRTLVDGEVRQDSSTAEMVFPVEAVLESVSRTMTLSPGDVVATGTPPGVGVHRDPPRLLEPGDSVSVEIEGVGTLQNTVVAERES